MAAALGDTISSASLSKVVSVTNRGGDFTHHSRFKEFITIAGFDIDAITLTGAFGNANLAASAARVTAQHDTEISGLTIQNTSSIVSDSVELCTECANLSGSYIQLRV